ncbi:hypothetical protein BASA50_005075 [Batrachochytrium salamandrivorans]|uniref:MULE transposase domain-containing protein n=1 Tax=Batrachochytrium salamandrivorans TaxID=1357716 RepID=A0ABQ8FDQ8_9FUNG|nr:hypothetical protein BASA50_005075 [Batrachochytrium salamandrivorans]
MTHSSPMATITSRPEYLGVRCYSKRDCPKVRSISTSAMRLQATEVLSTVPNVRPSSLINLACLKHGVTSSYSSAWRALQSHRQDINKADVMSFGQIPYPLHEIEIANSGSTTYVAATSEGIFDNAFLCLGPMRNAFNHCRPMLIVDACHIKSKYGGVIMAASAHDGDNHIIPIAIGLYNIENEMNWKHFFLKLAEAIPEIKQPKFGGQIWAAAKAGSQVKHDEAMATIAEIDCDAAEYLKNSDPKRWARSHFPVPRFGTVTSNSAESLNSWMEEYRDKSHLGILACWVSHSARLLYSRKQEYANADTVLSPRSFRTFNQNRDNGRRHQMFQTGDHLFKVTSLTSGYTRMIVSVDLDTINCDEALQSPNVVKKAGRPRKVRLRSRGEVDDNDRYACKGCGLLGHNVRTFSRRQPPSVLPVDLEEGNQEPFQQQLDIGNLNGGSGSKRARVRNVVCINCGGNHYRKTPCRVPSID